MKPLKRGDRVKRRIDIYDSSKGYKYGTVAYKYGRRRVYIFSEDLGYYPELYAVRWDHKPNEIRQEYLRHGINKIIEYGDIIDFKINGVWKKEWFVDTIINDMVYLTKRGRMIGIKINQVRNI